MPTWRVRWTEVDHLETFIDAESAEEARQKFEAREYSDTFVVRTDFHEGPEASLWIDDGDAIDRYTA